MPLPLAFAANPPGVGKKLYSIREDDEDGDADDASLAILRSERRATPPASRFASRSLDDDATRKNVASNIKDSSSQRTRQGHAGPSSYESNTDDCDYEELANEYEDDCFDDSPRINENSTETVSSGACSAEASIEDALPKSDQRNVRHAPSNNVVSAKPSVVQCEASVVDINELRKQQQDILRCVSSSQEDVSAIRRDLRELHSLLAKRSDSDDSSRSLQILLQSLTEEVRVGNVKCGESLSILRVSFDAVEMTSVSPS
jgi:hypothetical protein